ncbi:3-hydroxyisobutyrate dehydrogenase [Shewanella sp. C32]|uniref:3-hydroxyisobutyrate dehydrogenase n=1 Tax=Shewanella electrica TaxID=515560 RepID=A0ABT2FGL8_9GAMM|nr:3-hydroxyisobutyrate dehydrogenase [Shewanella electrica]MCH1923356.1 3-hydroxyisobutyrate dehydrogenase [Shewanella electrica]MCS4555453.1 3-hydroxyisobutyrate dehydrogenase [Shewanella electrica]
MTTVAFIGLGNMGAPMAANLLKNGFGVRVFDLVPATVSTLAAQGAEPCSSAIVAAQDAAIVISMLPEGRHAKALYLGDEKGAGLITQIHRDSLLIDCSTIDADSARAIAAAADARGMAFVDAPVSGGTAGAIAATLTFICGGSESAVARAKPVLQAMGRNIFHAGPAGSGQIAKICNNMLLGVLMAGTCEALSLGIDNGLDPAVLSDIIKASSGGNWTLEKYNPCPGVMAGVPASNDYKGGFMVDLMVKDLGLATQAALSTRSAMPMGALARNLFVHHAKQGHGHEDFSSLFCQYRPKSN